MRALNPDSHLTQDTVLLREAEHALRVLAWQKTEDGQKRTPQRYPERFPITAKEIEKAEAERRSKQADRPDAMTLDEANTFLGW